MNSLVKAIRSLGQIPHLRLFCSYHDIYIFYSYHSLCRWSLELMLKVEILLTNIDDQNEPSVKVT